MFNDFEDQLMELAEMLLEEYDLEELLEKLDLTPEEALTKLVLDGHIDEEVLSRLA